MHRDRQSERRDRPFHVLEYHRRYWNEELVKYMPYRPGLCVLDVGCGQGLLLDQLDGRTGGAWGIDQVLPPAKVSFAPAQVSLAQVDRLPFPSGAFDVVFGHDTLSKAAEPERSLFELARVLRPGGWLVLWEARWRLERTVPGDLARRMRRYSLLLTCQEPVDRIHSMDYVAFPVVVLLAHVPLLATAYLSQTIAKVAFAVDGLIARMPALRDKSWHTIVVAEKGSA